MLMRIGMVLRSSMVREMDVAAPLSIFTKLSGRGVDAYFSPLLSTKLRMRVTRVWDHIAMLVTRKRS
jgi:hypothetical protein